MGRGQYFRRYAKISTAHLYCVRLADFKKHKCLTPGWSYRWRWTRDVETGSSVCFTVADSFIRFDYTIKGEKDNTITVSKTIPLTLTPCNFGGHRKWFLCDCGRKVATMFIQGQNIACRHCFNAVYPSQREDSINRQWRKIYKLESKLQEDRYKPKGMHWKTFARIKHEWMRAHIKKDQLFVSGFSRRFPGMEI